MDAFISTLVCSLEAGEDNGSFFVASFLDLIVAKTPNLKIRYRIMKLKHQLRTLQSEIVGELDEASGLAQFRGIPYASVEKRWRHSRTRHTLPSSPFDATEYGPRCSQEEGPVLVSGGVTDPAPGDDEFKCLNLNITVPVDALDRKRPLLPVMFWIHGGGFDYGANSVARYRPLVLSSMAIQAGTPVVLVQIGYRLGPLGFAASEDLATEQDSVIATDFDHNGDVAENILGNYGLVDQRNALLWVRDHIRDFGGDPANVTAFGISAGSASVHFHILSDPLFDRAIMMSGSAPTLGPLPFKYFEREWRTLCDECGVEGDNAASRLAKLRALSPEEIINRYKGSAMGPLADGKLMPTDWRLGQQSTPTRCKEVILGDTGIEAIIFDGLSSSLPQAQFQRLVRAAFSSTRAAEFLQVFGLTSDDLPYEQYRDAMRSFLSLALFQFPNVEIAESFGQHAYLYHFEEPSPYPGPTFGVPYHGQCALFMYNNETETYPESSKRVAKEMARTWISFANGKEPWEPFTVSRRFMRFGPRGESALYDIESDKLRNYDPLSWLERHFEEVKEFAQSLLHDHR